jgi:ribosome-associated toxin RatA of RatAB toxin-antitoxin module
VDWRAILLAQALVPPVAARAGGDEFSAEELQRLEAGEILTWTRPVAGRSVPWTKASGLVAAPPAAVWPIIDDCARYKDTMPRTVTSEELERHGDHVSCRATGDMPFPFADLVTETDAVHTIEPGKVYRREWKQRSGDFEVNEGRWTLQAWRGGTCTLATYEALAEPKIAIPEVILGVAMRRTLPDMIAALREHAKTSRDDGSRGTALFAEGGCGPH